MAARIKTNKTVLGKDGDSQQNPYQGNPEDLAAVSQRLEKGLESRVAELKESFENKTLKSTEALGIFVALFTFVSVSVQVFSRVEGAATAGAIIFLIFIALASFVILLNLFLVRSPETIEQFLKSYQFLLLVVLFVFAALTISILHDNRIAFQPIADSGPFRDAIENMIDKKKGDVEQKVLDEFKACIRQKGLATCVR